MAISERQKQKAKEWRQNNPEKMRVYQKKKMDERYALMVERKQQACSDCGINYPHYVMDFDHRNPEEKEFTIAHCRGYSKERIINEMNKCDVVCSNCHRIRTYGL